MKLLSALLLSSTLAVAAGPVWAQANTIPSQPHLLVKGEASRTVMPDRFALQMDLDEVDMDADAARRRVQANVVRVLALLEQHQAVKDSVRAENLRISPATRYEDGKQIFVGTRVARELRGSFASTKNMQAFLAALKANEHLQVRSLTPAYSEEVSLRRTLKGEAAGQTRQSAQQLAKAYGTRIRSLYSISDVAPEFAYGVQAGQWPSTGEGDTESAQARLNDITVTGSHAPAAPPTGESVQAGPITYTEHVYAIFLITDGS